MECCVPLGVVEWCVPLPLAETMEASKVDTLWFQKSNLWHTHEITPAGEPR